MPMNDNGVQVYQQYVGARYVPKFFSGAGGSTDWVQGVTYEPLTVVTYLGYSYTSKKPVPSSVGNPPNNPTYWALTGNTTAQIAQLTQRVETLENSLYGVYYDTFAELASSELHNNQIVSTAGYYSPFDGGGATYIITSNPPEGFYEIVGSLFAVIVDTGNLTFKSFGCKGDGVTDDTARFQAAINEVTEISGLAQDTYLISSTINISGKIKNATILIPSNVSLANGVLYATNKSNISLQNLNIKGTGTFPELDGNLDINAKIYVYMCDNIEINGCSIELYTHCVILDKCSNISVKNNSFTYQTADGNNYSKIMLSIRNCTDGEAIISENSFIAQTENFALNTSPGAIFIANSTIKCLIKNNKFIKVGRAQGPEPLSPVDLYTGNKNITIDANYFENCCRLSRISNTSFVSIINNIFNEISATNPDSPLIVIFNSSRYSLKVDTGSIVVAGNIINQKSTAVSFVGASTQYADIAPHDLLIQNNIITSTSQKIFDVTGGVSNLKISGNKGSAQNGYFILLNQEGTTIENKNVIISDNEFSGNSGILESNKLTSVSNLEIKNNNFNSALGISIKSPAVIHGNNIINLTGNPNDGIVTTSTAQLMNAIFNNYLYGQFNAINAGGGTKAGNYINNVLDT